MLDTWEPNGTFSRYVIATCCVLQVLAECVRTSYFRLRKLQYLSDDAANETDNAIAHVFENMCAFIHGIMWALDSSAPGRNEIAQYGVLSLALPIRALSRIPPHSIPSWVSMTCQRAHFFLPLLPALLKRTATAMTGYRYHLIMPIPDTYNINSQVHNSDGPFETVVAVLELVSCDYWPGHVFGYKVIPL